jgi:hypothetical protein
MTDYIFDPETGEFRESGTSAPQQPPMPPHRPRATTNGTGRRTARNYGQSQSSNSNNSGGGCCSWLIYLAIFLFFLQLCA